MIAAAAALCQREIVRFFRQRSRIVGAVVPPVIFWFVIGTGLSATFRHQDSLNYLQYFFPGTVVMIVLFSSIFSTISIIEDRREGFLQSVLVAPVPRAAISLGKVLGGTAIAVIHGTLFLLISPWVGASLSPLRILAELAVLMILSFGLTALGFFIAWRMDSTQGFHAVMNLFLMPMWFLSGSLFPIEGAPGWLKALMVANPLTYGVKALERLLYAPHPALSPAFPSLPLSLGVGLAFGAFMFAASVFISARVSRP